MSADAAGGSNESFTLQRAALVFWPIHIAAACVVAAFDRSDGFVSAALTVLVYLALPSFVVLVFSTVAGLGLRRVVPRPIDAVLLWIALLLPAPVGWILIGSAMAVLYLLPVQVAVGFSATHWRSGRVDRHLIDPAGAEDLARG